MIWSDFYDLVRIDVPAVESDMVDFAILRAAREFLLETGAYVVDAAAVNVVAGTATYNLVSPVSLTDVAYIKQGWVNEFPLTPITLDELGAVPRYWPSDEADQPDRYVQQTQDTVTLYPKPAVAYTGGLVTKLAVYPSLTATGVADWVGARYAEDLAEGAKAVLMEMRGKPWSSVDGAKLHRGNFEAAKTAGISDANKSFTRRAQKARMSRSW